MQKKADDVQPSRSMGAAVRVLRLECSGSVKFLAETASTDNRERGKGEGGGTHNNDIDCSTTTYYYIYYNLSSRWHWQAA